MLTWESRIIFKENPLGRYTHGYCFLLETDLSNRRVWVVRRRPLDPVPSLSCSDRSLVLIVRYVTVFIVDVTGT